VLDVGGGASLLADNLVRRGFSDVTVLDISGYALDASRRRMGTGANVTFVQADLLAWRPSRSYDLWHDRAAFHFLVADEDRETYVRTLREAVAPGGLVILATFAPDGPPTCSGRPVLRYSIDGLTTILGETFDRLESLREEHITPGGSIQPFSWVAGRMWPAEARDRGPARTKGDQPQARG
jgi:SAM-dependent methyltransferase